MGEEKEKYRKFLFEFISCYRSLPDLWNPTSSGFRSLSKRKADSLILLDKYRERFPGATLNEMIRKICELRNRYREGKNRRGPKTSYCDAMSFIDSHKKKSEHKLKSSSCRNDHREAPETKRAKLNHEDYMKRLLIQNIKEMPSILKIDMEIWYEKMEQMNFVQVMLTRKLINDVVDQGLMRTLTPRTRISIGFTADPLLDPEEYFKDQIRGFLSFD